MQTTRRVFACIAVVLTLACSGVFADAAGSASGAPPKWSVVPAPAPTPGYLAGVSCATFTRCATVGTAYVLPTARDRALIGTLRGATWSHAPSPFVQGSEELRAVSCATPTHCVAVGGFVYGVSSIPLMETLNGSRWSVTRNRELKSVGGSLVGVSCPTVSFCVAVGSTETPRYGPPGHPIIDMWNGRRWSIVPSPDLTKFGASHWVSDVSCTSPTHCVVVGDVFGGNGLQPVIESWNGSRWSIALLPADGDGRQSLFSVSCPSATSCSAVGVADMHTLAYVWDGVHWTRTPSINASDRLTPHRESVLSAVSCVSATSCVAVGNYKAAGQRRPIIERWNGRRWTREPGPNAWTRGKRVLTDVSCRVDGCVAVGADETETQTVPIIVRSPIRPRAVTVPWSAADAARLETMASYFHESPAAVQKRAVYAFRFVTAGTRAASLTPAAFGDDTTYRTIWTPPELDVIDSVAAEFRLSPVGATKVAVYFLSYVLAAAGH